MLPAPRAERTVPGVALFPPLAVPGSPTIGAEAEGWPDWAAALAAVSKGFNPSLPVKAGATSIPCFSGCIESSFWLDANV
jgi:hypothetical protein